MSEEDLGWVERVGKAREKRGKRMKILAILGGTILGLALLVGIVAYVTNPSLDDFTAWHEKRIHEQYEKDRFFPATPAEKRQFYSLYIERKSYIFFSRYVTKTEFYSLERSIRPYLRTPPEYRTMMGKPSEYLPKDWRSETLYLGLFGSFRYQLEEEE